MCAGVHYMEMWRWWVHRALKKQIEQVEKGELDSELPDMWEEMQK